MKSYILCAVLVSGMAPLASACGPWLPKLLLGDEKQYALRSPAAELVTEVRHLSSLPKLPTGLKPQPLDLEEYHQLRSGELVINRNEKRDVAAALAYYHVPESRRESMAAEYWKVRDVMAANRPAELVPSEEKEALEAGLHATPLPADLPAELAEYLEGAIAFECGNLKKARTLWQQLLARPAPERRFRSTWAAYMLGRMAAWSIWDDDAKRMEAIRWLQYVRTLVQEGCEDGLNLVGLSYYWEADLQDDKDLDEQARLYGLSLAAGCGWAVDALGGLGETILEAADDSVREHAVRVPLLRQLATARALVDLADAGWEQNETERQPLARWLAAIDKAGFHEVEEADRLAWACYDLGNFGAATAWLKKAPVHAPMALWLRGKLALRAGHNVEAVQSFTLAARHFPEPAAAIYPHHNWWQNTESDSFLFLQARQLQADLGVTELACAHFPQALEHFLQSGTWLDAAYVADQVMTTRELADFVHRHSMPEAIPVRPGPEDYDDPDDPIPIANLRKDAPQALRYLLARRLAREGKLDEAREYMPGPLLNVFDAYCAEYRRGHNRHVSTEERAAALWEAARVYRRHGMELFGSEAAPDWSFYDGQYELSDVGGLRNGTAAPLYWVIGEKFSKTPWLPHPSAAEIARYARQRPTPNARFHYRYVAADLAWQAAKLRPPNEETAEMLCTAGGWLKDRDPKAADRFYQELVGRCRQTALGMEGEKKRWFPMVHDAPLKFE